MTRVGSAGRGKLLRTGLLGMTCSCLWSRPSYGEPVPCRMLTAFIYFLMGMVEVFGGVTGIYFSNIVVRLGVWHVIFGLKIEDWLGVPRDPELSERIIDPRHRLAALEVIEKSMATARRLE